MDDLMTAYLGEWRNDGHKGEQLSGDVELVSASEGAPNSFSDAHGSSNREVEIDENGTKNGTNDGNEVGTDFIYSTSEDYADSEVHGKKNAGKRVDDADRDDTKDDGSKRKKQKTSDSPNEDNNDDGSEVRGWYHYSEEKCEIARIDACSREAFRYHQTYKNGPLYGGPDKCFSWRVFTSKCHTLTALLEQFASNAPETDIVFGLDDCYSRGHDHTGMDGHISITAAALAYELPKYEYMLQDPSEELSKRSILYGSYTITRSCLNQWCDNLSHCHLVTSKNGRDECLKLLQQAVRRNALGELSDQCREHDPPCNFKHGSLGTQQHITTMWAHFNDVKSFLKCPKRRLGTWTSEKVRDQAKDVTLNGEKLPNLPIAHAQPSNPNGTLDRPSKDMSRRKGTGKGKEK